jgi:hypothetical protein
VRANDISCQCDENGSRDKTIHVIDKSLELLDSCRYKIKKGNHSLVCA